MKEETENLARMLGWGALLRLYNYFKCAQKKEADPESSKNRAISTMK